MVQIRRATAISQDDWVDCAVCWRHPALDLALLEVTPADSQRWDSPVERSPRLAGLSDRSMPCEAVGFPDAQLRPDQLRDTDHARGWLLPGGGARDPDGLIPFDQNATVPDDANLWAGFSGSAVQDEHGRIVAVVAKVHPDRERRRLLVLPLEDAATGGGFVRAAESVGLLPVVEDWRADVWRSNVADLRTLTDAGVPVTIGQVKDLRAIGVHPAVGNDSDRDPYPAYLPRDKDGDLDAALTAGRGGGRR